MSKPVSDDAPKEITWVPQANGAYHKFSVLAGMDSGKNVYVARAYHNGGIIPGKLHVGHVHAYIPFGGKEISHQEYEMMIAAPGSISWIETTAANIPAGAIEGGKDPSGEVYYIGRAIHQGAVVVGKVLRSHGTCYVAHGGKEHGYKDYKILVRSW